jgi:hypothetical protein
LIRGCLFLKPTQKTLHHETNRTTSQQNYQGPRTQSKSP